jgi:mannosylglycoprotein endo-beta-mannosidase
MQFDARRIGDFRPISLTHSVGKIISKLLASRLALELNVIVSRAQSAFIKCRSIQDNFLYTQNLIRALHKGKEDAFFLKLDIAKAFDSVRWDLLLEVLENLGFGPRWCGWVSALLASSSTAILLNGARGQWYRHRTGLRQGDPLSPMLFILTMEPLQRLFDIAAEDGLLSPFCNRAARLRCSMCADDAALFVKLVRDDIATVAEILDIVGRASGLMVNHSKCAVYLVHCVEVDVEAVLQDFQCLIKNFPCTYLGLPLHYRQLRRVEFQPLIDKVGNMLPAWKGRFLNRAGCLKLMITVLTAIPTFFLTVFAPKKWLVKKLDKLRRGFLWKGTDDAIGGHCLVQWAKVKRPKALGGLGVLDFEHFSRALRLRWLWFQWTNLAQPWVGTDVPCSKDDKQLFRASTCVTVGNGVVARF